MDIGNNNLNINIQDPFHVFSKKSNELTELKLNFKKKYNFFDKISAWYLLSEKSIYKKKMQTFYSEASKTFKISELMKIATKCSREQLNFLKHIVDCKKVELSQIKNINGYYWKATKIDPKEPSKSISHYIIGTVHIAAKNHIHNHKLEEALSNSKQLITEVFTPLVCKLYKVMQFFSKDPLGHGMDALIAEKAVKQNKNSQQFETVLDQLKVHSKNFKIDPFLPIKNLFKKYNLYEEQKKMIFEMIIISSIAKWVIGNDQSFTSSETIDDAQRFCLDERNLRWIKKSRLRDDKYIYRGLEEYINKSKTPTSIAVGLLHTFGDNGLLQMFENNGFTLERM